MSRTHFATTGRCCRYRPARNTNPRISDLPLSASVAFQVLIDVLIAASRKRPILGIVEDVQWMDPTTIDLLVRIIARCSGERIMILITHRDDYQRGLVVGPGSSTDCPAKAGTARMRANGRSRRRRRYRVAPDYQPDRGKNRWRAALRRGVYAGRDRFPRRSRAPLTTSALSEKLPKPLVPSSIHNSLMERLDRLGPAKRVAQIASVFGRQFTYEGILNVLPGRGQTLKHALQALESAGIVYRIEESQGPVSRSSTR